jgi:hypothetical protein
MGTSKQKRSNSRGGCRITELEKQIEYEEEEHLKKLSLYKDQH